MTARALVEAAQTAGIEEDGVRIVQLTQHSCHGFLIEHGIGEGVHVVAPHVRDHFLEQSRAFAIADRRMRDPFPLHQPATRHQGTRHRRGDDYRS